MTHAAPPLSLYVHIPWCVKKCPYCDFNSHARESAMPVDAYIDATLADLDRDIERFHAALAGRNVLSIFFGGGTPSLFAPDEIARLIDGAAARLAFRDGIEITMETNPETSSLERMERFRESGVNRISFGVQSFREDELRRLGRLHSAARARDAVAESRAAGFDNVSLDLMMWLPEQSTAQWQESVEALIGVGPEHAWLKDTGRAEYVTITDDEALQAFHDCCRVEGIIPALESAHALAYAMRLGATLPKDKILLVNLSGRGDKDMATVAQRSGLAL